ncbi:hypothetical protein TNCV_2675441 [Trichonephila clavipes]|nr:hypothetical protein TNCV_2675441 [Trichonephila clavipes]
MNSFGAHIKSLVYETFVPSVVGIARIFVAAERINDMPVIFQNGRTLGSRATRLCSQGTNRQRFVLFLLLLLLKQDYEGPYHIASMKVNIAFLARKPSGHGRELVTKVIGSWVRNLGPLQTRRVENLMHIQEEGASSCVVLFT